MTDYIKGPRFYVSKELKEEIDKAAIEYLMTFKNKLLDDLCKDKEAERGDNAAWHG